MQSNPKMKTCYYEVLEVDRQATQKEIDKGYKKAALKWHPDKNQGQDTTKIFQEIREAHAVLSDPQERAWYDGHRDQILRGKDVEEDTEDDQNYITKSKLWPFFSQSCFSGYNSTKENNFYTVYGNLFKTLDKEEEMEELEGEHHFEAPFLGDELSTAEEVFKFYNHWQHFTTLKQFAYADKYNPNQAPNRRIKRIIETENKKERNTERKEFNDQVIQLIEYVKKRDPRYQKFKMQEQREKELKKQQEEDAKNKKRLEEQEKLRKYREELAQKFAQEEEEALASGNYEEVLVEEFRCGVCKKVFKNERQMQNHLQSKKHKDNYAMFKETVELDEDTEKVIHQEEERKRKLLEEAELLRRQEQAKEYEKQEKKKTRKANKNVDSKNPEGVEEDKEEVKAEANVDGSQEESKQEAKEEEEEEQYVSKNKLKKMNKQNSKVPKNATSSGSTVKEQFMKLDKKQQEELINVLKNEEAKKPAQQKKGGKKAGKNTYQDDEDEEFFQAKGNKKSKPIKGKVQYPEEQIKPKQLSQKKTAQPQKEEVKEEEAKVEQEPKVENEETKVVEDAKIEDPTKQEQEAEPKPDEKEVKQEDKYEVEKRDGDEEEASEEEDNPKLKKKDKRKQKKQKKEEETKSTSNKCNICKTDFETRNQLFTHIKKTGHARAV